MCHSIKPPQVLSPSRVKISNHWSRVSLACCPTSQISSAEYHKQFLAFPFGNRAFTWKFTHLCFKRGFIFPTSSNATTQTIFTFHTFAYIRHNIGNSSAYNAISFILRGKHHTMHRIHHSIAYN